MDDKRKWLRFCGIWNATGHSRYPERLAEALEQRALLDGIHERVADLVWDAAAGTRIRESLADSSLPIEIRRNLVMRWYHGSMDRQPQLPMTALAALLEVGRRNAQPEMGDPPEGEDLYSLEPIPLHETARFRKWNGKTYTHIAVFSSLGLQPHYWCLEDREWVCL